MVAGSGEVVEGETAWAAEVREGGLICEIWTDEGDKISSFCRSCESNSPEKVLFINIKEAGIMN